MFFLLFFCACVCDSSLFLFLSLLKRIKSFDGEAPDAFYTVTTGVSWDKIIERKPNSGSKINFAPWIGTNFSFILVRSSPVISYDFLLHKIWLLLNFQFLNILNTVINWQNNLKNSFSPAALKSIKILNMFNCFWNKLF